MGDFKMKFVLVIFIVISLAEVSFELKTYKEVVATTLTPTVSAPSESNLRITEPPPPSPTDICRIPNLPDSALIPDVYNCKQFHRCIKVPGRDAYDMITFRCDPSVTQQGGFIFDPVLGICNYYNLVEGANITCGKWPRP